MSKTWYPVTPFPTCTACGSSGREAHANACCSGEACGCCDPSPAASQNDCACGDAAASTCVAIDFLYLDLNTCQRCMGADAALDEAVDELKGILGQLGYTITVNKVNIQSPELAEQYRFVSSPTLRVNGADICADVAENACADCGDICGTDTMCRVFTWAGRQYDSPPKAMIMDGILRALYAPEAPKDDGAYTLPVNLADFFTGAS